MRTVEFVILIITNYETVCRPVISKALIIRRNPAFLKVPATVLWRSICQRAAHGATLQATIGLPGRLRPLDRRKILALAASRF